MKDFINPINHSFPHTIRKMEQFAADYNADKPLKEQCRPMHVSCWINLLAMWQAQYNDTPKQIRPYAEFRTSHAAIATRLGCCKRTAKAYTQRLQDCGAIEKTFHGSNTTVSIRFKADLVACFPSIHQLSTDTENQSITKAKVQTLPHIVPLNLEEKKKQAVEKVARSVWLQSHDGVNHAQNRQSGDSRATSSVSIDSGKDTPTGSLQDTQRANNYANSEGQPAGDWRAPGTLAVDRQQPDTMPNPGKPTEGKELHPRAQTLSVGDLAKLFSLVARLWTFLESMLSESHSYLSEHQQNIGLQHLMHELAKAGPAGFDSKYFEMMGALFCVRDYLGGRPGRYVPLPSVYFDPANPNGWEGAKRWYARQERKGDRIAEMKTEFQAQIHLYRAARDAIRPHLRNPYDLETYRKMAQRLGHLDPKLQDAVNSLIANGQLLKQAS